MVPIFRPFARKVSAYILATGPKWNLTFWVAASAADIYNL
jgi:hypothetical protein